MLSLDRLLLIVYKAWRLNIETKLVRPQRCSVSQYFHHQYRLISSLPWKKHAFFYPFLSHFSISYFEFLAWHHLFCSTRPFVFRHRWMNDQLATLPFKGVIASNNLHIARQDFKIIENWQPPPLLSSQTYQVNSK